MNPAPAAANEIDLAPGARQMPRRRILLPCSVELPSFEERQRRALGRRRLPPKRRTIPSTHKDGEMRALVAARLTRSFIEAVQTLYAERGAACGMVETSKRAAADTVTVRMCTLLLPDDDRATAYPSACDATSQFQLP